MMRTTLFIIVIDVAVAALAIWMDWPHPGLIVSAVNLTGACLCTMSATVNIRRGR